MSDSLILDPEYFKDSALGPIPIEWGVNTLASICQRITDGAHQSIETTAYGVPFLFVSCVRNGQILWDQASRISEALYKQISRGREPKPGLIIYTAVGSYGHAALIQDEQPFSFQRHIAYVLPDADKVEPRFLVAWLNSPMGRSYADKVALGNAQKTVTLGNLSSFPIPSPNLWEQRRIADILDTVDAAIQQTEALIAKLKLMKAGLLHDLLTRGLDEQGNLRDPIAHPEQFKDSPLGRIPRGWGIKTLSQVAETYAGGTPSRSVAGMFGGQIPWVKSAELNQVEIAETEESLSQMGYQSSSVKWVPENTPLIAMYGATAGVVSWLKICAVTNQAVLAVPPRTERTDARWLYWVLSFNSWKLVASVQGSGQPNLSKSLIDALRIAQPVRLEEQRAIATILDAHDARLRAEEAYCDKLKQLKQGLMRDLLTGRVRVRAEKEVR